MVICVNNHQMIVFDEGDCPLCDEQEKGDKLQDTIDDLKDQIDEYKAAQHGLRWRVDGNDTL
jgi:hypothetical protein